MSDHNYKTYEVIVYKNGDTHWFFNGKLHREGQPAVEYASGTKQWWVNGQLHRENGPATERADGDKHWYLNGIEYTEAEFLTKTTPAPYEGKMVEIDGKKYKLVARS